MENFSRDKANRNPAGRIHIVSGLLAIVILSGSMIFSGCAKAPADQGGGGGDLTITKSSITEQAQFIPYQSGTTKMEIIAVMASDGSIRTALNTCQVCYDSGRGYYQQEGNELVCQNCGNRFLIDQVEKIKGGCNPVPILPADKVEDEKNIVISQTYLADNAKWFLKWGKI